MTFIARACQCASTSTAAACRHALLPSTTKQSRSLSSKAPVRSPEAAPSTSAPTRDDVALDYTAPLWYQDVDGSRWFAPLPGNQRQRDWRGWIRESRVGPSSPSTAATVEQLGRWFSPPPPPPAILVQQQQEKEREKQRRALERYISLPPSPSATTSAPVKSTRRRSDLTRMRKTARSMGLKVVESQLAAEVAPSAVEVDLFSLEDVDVRTLLASATSLGPTPPHSTADLPAELSVEQLKKAWEAFVAPPSPSSPLTSPATNSIARLRPRISSAADFAHKDDFQLALSLLVHISSPVSASSALEAGRSTLALDILRTLLSSSALTASEVAAPPSYAFKSGEELPQEITLRTVLLRTVVPLALGDGNVELATKACEELVALRLEHEEAQAGAQDTTERVLVQRTAEKALDLHRRGRAVTYRSHLQSRSSRTDIDTRRQLEVQLERGHTHLSLFRRLLLTPPSSTFPDGVSSSSLPANLVSVISAFAHESVALRRWDLLSSMYLSYSPLGFPLSALEPRIVRGLAKYYSGDLFLRGAHGSTKGLARKREWDMLVQATGREIRRGAIMWGELDKAEWLELLTSSRLKDAESAREAVELYEVWGGVVVPPRTVLTMARASLKLGKGTDFGQRLARDYIIRLTSSSSPFSTLTSPEDTNSSIRQRKTTIPHYDLTTLASLYTLLGDQSSVAQVYAKMLEFKILPDERDVDGILKGVWESTSVPSEEDLTKLGEERAPTESDIKLEKALAFLSWASGVGVRLTASHFDSVLRRIAAPPDSPEEMAAQRRRVTRTVALAKRLGISEGECAGMKSMARLLRRDKQAWEERRQKMITRRLPPTKEELDQFVVSTKTGHFTPALLHRQLVALLPISNSHWRLSHYLHLNSVRNHGFQDDRSISLILRILLGPYTQSHQMMKQERVQLRRAMREVVEELVNPSALSVAPRPPPSTAVAAEIRPTFDPPLSPVTSQATADVVYRALLKLDDPEAVGKVVRRLGEVEPSSEMKEKVKRWLGGKKGGREIVDGWLASNV